MNKLLQIGFSQRLQLEWLEHTAALVLARQPRDHVETALQHLLHDKLSIGGTAQRGNREKAITILLKTWVAVPKYLQPFRDDGLEHLQRLPICEHIAVHWGMTLAVYPFFGAVAETAGRLVRLQEACVAAQVQRRLREQLGERETVARAARRILRCFVDWGVLQETRKKGIYQATPARLIQDKRLATWLIEAVLLTNSTDTGALKTLIQTPTLFPFRIAPLYATDLEGHGRLDLFRQGMDEDMITLRHNSYSASKRRGNT